ncbi:MAG: hypothetical protein KDD38_00180 [Bdellovibrionales bacterium]|nr:hypothetical protein [Bdellovibrionales bacterium]
MTDFIKNYLDQLTSQYPATKDLADLAARFELLVSDVILRLPLSVYNDAATAIQSIYAHAHSEKVISELKKKCTSEEQAILDAPIQNNSVLMAYDFHYDFDSQKLSLIEINTNASAYLIVDQLYKSQNHEGNPWSDPLAALKKSFFTEIGFAPHSNNCRVAIIDDHIKDQRMYPEFLMYKSLFESWGLSTQLRDQDQIRTQDFDFIYNRSTDFLFSDSKLAPLKTSFLSGAPIFSPHPREYLLLAAKDRLIQFAKDRISKTIPDCFELKKHTDIDAVWANRKNLFFKPLRMYGSKGAYRGSSISKTAFDRLLSQDFLVQEYCPPGTYNDWKFDLRFYVYTDQIQMACARIYKGQVTNFLTPGGGLSCLAFV